MIGSDKISVTCSGPNVIVLISVIGSGASVIGCGARDICAGKGIGIGARLIGSGVRVIGSGARGIGSGARVIGSEARVIGAGRSGRGVRSSDRERPTAAQPGEESRLVSGSYLKHHYKDFDANY